MDSFNILPKKIKGINVVEDITEAVSHIKENKTICRFEYGDSMSPILNNGEFYYTIKINDILELKKHDAVVCEVNGYLMTHMVLDIDTNNKRVLISSSHGEIYGWTDKVFAKALPFSPRIYIQNFFN